MQLSVSNRIVSSKKNYEKRYDFDFDIVSFPCLDGDALSVPSYGVYISQLIRFARVSSHLAHFGVHNKTLTPKLLQKGIGIINFRTVFSKFYRRQYELISKYGTVLKHFCYKACRNTISVRIHV